MVVVTGGTGYIGSHTVVQLIEAGYDVTVLDDLSNSSIEVLDSIKEITGTQPKFVKVDLSDASATQEVFMGLTNVRSVIHFAAKKAVGESVEKPLLYYKNNIGALLNLLIEMESNGISNLVFSSSCTVYGQPDKCPVTEETPRKEAESPYGNTKSISEDIIRDTANVIGLNAISLRYFNPIGAHASGKIGELPTGIPNNLVPFVTQTAAGIRKELVVHGNDYNTPDGTCIRDYIHVVDLAKAHLSALARIESGKQKARSEVFNIGTGKGSSVLEVIQTFESVTNTPLKYKIGPRREGDITEVFADTTYANKELNWKAELGLKEGLGSSWNWEQNYRQLKKQ